MAEVKGVAVEIPRADIFALYRSAGRLIKASGADQPDTRMVAISLYALEQSKLKLDCYFPVRDR